MFVKLTSKNQITLPQTVVRKFAGTRKFEVTVERGCIVLTPFRTSGLSDIWYKLESIGISEKDIDDAIRQARRRG